MGAETEAYYRRQNVRQRRSRIPLTPQTVPANTGGNLDLPAVRISAPIAGVTAYRENNQGGQIDVIVGGSSVLTLPAKPTRGSVGLLNAGDLVNLRLVTGFSGSEIIRFFGADGQEIGWTRINASG